MSMAYIPTPLSPLQRALKNDFLVAAVIAVVLSGLTFALAYSVGWLTDAPNWFEVAGATINYGATYLSIKQRRLAYTLGFLASGAFAVAYFQYGLLASSILSLYLVGQLIYGYFRWGPDGNTRPVHHLQWKWAPAYVVATAAVWYGAYLIVTALGGQFAFWDAAILVFTIAAQFLLDNKVIEAWYVWTAVNIIGVVLYFTAGAPFAAVQQLIFGLANIWGFLAWRKSMQNSSENFSEGAISKNHPKEENGLLFTEIPSERGLGKGRAAKENLVKGDDGIKRLEILDEAPVKRITGSDVPSLKDMKFDPGAAVLLSGSQVPIIRDSETWRRLVPTEASQVITHGDEFFVIEKDTVGIYKDGQQTSLFNRETGEAL